MNKKITSAFIALTLCTATFAVQPELTDLPNAYGEQLWNSTFDGEWDANNETTGWNSFGSARCDLGSFVCGLAGIVTKNQSGYSDDLRPGAQAGGKSGKTNARNAMGVVANGNITTGKIVGGSATATNLTGNFNFTDKDDVKYNTPFTSKPDSVTVWVKLTTNDDANNARMSVLLHDGTSNCQDAPSREEDRNSIVGFAETKFNRVGEWKRLTVPFQYEQYTSFSDFAKSAGEQVYEITSTTPEYILLTFSTNEKGGGGTASDVLLIDDILMIYKPTLAVENTSGSSLFEAGEEITIAYTITGTMSPYNLNAEANVVSLELSDAAGSFAAPTVLDTKTTDASGVFTVNLPERMETGDGYKLRVQTTNYPMTSDEIAIEIVEPRGGETGIEATTSENSVSIYPNPVQSTLFVETATGVEKALIYTVNGVKVAEEQVLNASINVASYAKGAYIIVVETKDGSTHRQLFVKK